MGYVILIDSKSEWVERWDEGTRGMGEGESTAVNQLSSIFQNYRKEEMMERQEVMREKRMRLEQDQKKDRKGL